MKRELGKLLGMDVKVKDLTETDQIPVYLASYRLFELSISGCCFVLAEIPQETALDIRILKRDLRRLSNIFNKKIAFSIPSLNSKQRAKLIENMIPFVSLPNQIYLPFLGLMLTEKRAEVQTSPIEVFTPSSQMLYLLFAYSRRVDMISKTEAAKRLGITKTSITRAASVLKAAGLITEEQRGTEDLMKKAFAGKEYVDKGLAHLIDPVKDVFYIKDGISVSAMPYSGESALSQMSMLNPPLINSKACRMKTDEIKMIDPIDPLLSADNDYFRLEIWRYDPKLFTQKGIVDPISLYCSLKDIDDERIENELERMLEEYQWPL